MMLEVVVLRAEMFSESHKKLVVFSRVWGGSRPGSIFSGHPEGVANPIFPCSLRRVSSVIHLREQHIQLNNMNNCTTMGKYYFLCLHKNNNQCAT